MLCYWPKKQPIHPHSIYYKKKKQNETATYGRSYVQLCCPCPKQPGFTAGWGDFSLGLKHLPVGGKHLFEKNAAILLVCPALFSVNHKGILVLKNQIHYGNLRMVRSNIPGDIDKPTLSKISFFTYITRWTWAPFLRHDTSEYACSGPKLNTIEHQRAQAHQIP